MNRIVSVTASIVLSAFALAAIGAESVDAITPAPAPWINYVKLGKTPQSYCITDTGSGMPKVQVCTGVSNQNWINTQFSDGYEIRNAQTNLCFEDSNDKGVPTYLRACSGLPNQRWNLVGDKYGTRIVSIGHGYCIDTNFSDAFQFICDNNNRYFMQHWLQQ